MRLTRLLSNLIVEEVSRFDALYDKLVKPAPSNDPSKPNKGSLPFEIFKQVILADPDTKKPDNFDVESASAEDMSRDVKVGKYSTWLLKNLLKPGQVELANVGNVEGLDPKSKEYKQIIKDYRNRYLEDLFKLTDLLTKFEQYRVHIPQENRDINKLTPTSLTNVILSIPKEVIEKKTKDKLKKEIRKEREGYSHPGATIEMVGSDYTLIKIEGTGDKQREAASWYGGYYDYQNGESHWCTSPPNSSYFLTYAKKGPLYVILANDDKGLVGKRTGLPQERYQFHFPDKQFMDRMDQQVDLVKMMNGPFVEFKDYFRKEFAKGLMVSGSDKVEITYPNSSAGLYVALYGFEELFNNLPTEIKNLVITNTSKETISLDIPESLGNLTNLESLYLENFVKTLPNSIGKLTNLMFLTLVNNKELVSVPESVGDIDSLLFMVLRECNPNVKIPQKILDNSTHEGDGFYSMD